jgi:lipopolysaccharide assembly outer membrane protein LptD (OstA)
LRNGISLLFIAFIFACGFHSKVKAYGLFNSGASKYFFTGGYEFPSDTDTVRTRTVSTDELKSKVKYNSKDTIRFNLAEDKVYLRNEAQITYENMNIKAGYIEIDWESKMLFATGMRDTNGVMQQLPVFKQDNQSFTAWTMQYNFETKKGKITFVTTQEGQGYIHGDTVKREANNDFYIRSGKYTTCNLDTPHFYIASNKLRVINQKKIVTGPAYLVLEDVPTPLVIPFGFFPNKKGRSSGLIFPTFGESASRGFYFQRIGWYFGFSDYFDAAITGDLYTLGSYLTNVSANYAKRYRFRGNIRLNYSEIKTSEPELNDYSLSRDFLVNWTHTQDAKARPGTNFGASVTAGTGSFYRNNLSSANNYLNNTYRSSISYSRSWLGTPFSLSAALNHSQSTLSHEIQVSAPDLSFNVARITPLKKKNRIGEEKWFEKIGTSYSMRAVNRISTIDSLLFKKESLDKFSNGIQHSLPLSTSFKVLKYFSLAPSVSYMERWYFYTVRKQFDAQQLKVVTETNRHFSAARDYSFTASLNTRIYGMFEFAKSPVAAIRHVMSPSIGFSYRPDFSETHFGYYKKYVSDTLGTESMYSIYEGQVFGGPAAGKAGIISFGFDNNIEMKVRSESDSGAVLKKIKLLESLSFNSGYNLAADSLRLLPISANGRTTLFEKINISFGASFDPYITTPAGVRRNQSELEINNRLARMTSAGVSLSANLASAQSEEKKEKIKDQNLNPDDYIDFSVPWSLNVSYTLNYSKPNDFSTSNTTQSLNFNGDLKLTERWKVGYTSGFDFKSHDFTYSSFSFYRDMHCWEMRMTWIPFGGQQSYNFQINVKSSVLQDLKLTKKNDFYDR